MSFKSMSFVLEQQLEDHLAKLVLIDLAHHHNEDYDIAFPSQKRIAQRNCVCEKTVQRKIKILCDLNLIIKIKRKNKTNAYKFNFDKVGDSVVPYEKEGRGLSSVPLERTQLSPIGKDSQESSNNIIKDISNDNILAFEEFWKNYIRKDGSKKRSRDKYLSTLKEKNITNELLLDALNKYNECMKDKEIMYIPHCFTWLSQRRWETVDELEKQTKFKREADNGKYIEKLFTGVTPEEFRSASRPRKRYYINNFGHQLTEYVNQGKLTLQEITYI